MIFLWFSIFCFWSGRRANRDINLLKQTYALLKTYPQYLENVITVYVKTTTVDE